MSQNKIDDSALVEASAETIQEQEKKDSLKKKRKQKDTVIYFLFKLAVVFLVFWAIFTFIFGITQANGEAMYPRIRDGDLIVFYRINRTYNIGDVVTFDINENQRFARIVARGGDVIELSEDGQLIVNGNIQQEEVHYPTEGFPGGITYPYTVPQSQYFVLCDFRTQSSDSRDYGAIPEDDIEGKVITLLRRRGI